MTIQSFPVFAVKVGRIDDDDDGELFIRIKMKIEMTGTDLT